MAINKMEVMPVAERWRPILKLLDETNLALPPKVIYINLSRQNRIEYGERTLKSYIKNMRKEGYVEYFDESGGYHIITDMGRESLHSNEDE